MHIQPDGSIEMMCDPPIASYFRDGWEIASTRIKGSGLVSADPDGLLVTGYGCDEMCDLYRIETSLYTAAGQRTWHEKEDSNDGLAYGSDVVFDSQGRALVAGAVTQNGKLRGYVFGRAVDNNWVTGDTSLRTYPYRLLTAVRQRVLDGHRQPI